MSHFDELSHPKFLYEKGLHQLGNGAYAWLQPDGGWGWSNSGLIVDGSQSLVVDTLYDVPLTQTMLKGYRKAEKAAMDIDKIVNTHHNGDHCNGNCCCPDAHIIAHKLTAEGMLQEPPSLMQSLLDSADSMGITGEFITSCFGPFDFKSVEQRIPDQLIEVDTTIYVGNKRVELLYVGPAHTKGDTLVYVPEDKTVFTGDILFIGGHPIVWEGPFSNWLRALDKILDLPVETIVPGHGPICTKSQVKQVKLYLQTVYDETKKRFQEGMSFFDAAMDIKLDAFSEWGDSERIMINVATVYRELGAEKLPNITEIFGSMAEYKHQSASNK